MSISGKVIVQLENSLCLAKQLLNNSWEMLVFQFMNALCERRDCIVGQHRAARLKNDVAPVVLLIHPMNRNAALRFTGLDHCLMHAAA